MIAQCHVLYAAEELCPTRLRLMPTCELKWMKLKKGVLLCVLGLRPVQILSNVTNKIANSQICLQVFISTKSARYTDYVHADHVEITL